MKSFLTILLFYCGLFRLSAQEKHFVFIQADNNQLFYVSLNGKLYSSTAAGYVIIPKLTAGEYNFSVGFAQNTFPEQGFQFVIDNKDLGFNLKNFGEKGWGLFNLQSLNMTMADSSFLNQVTRPVTEQAAPKEDVEPLITFEKKKKKPEVKKIADTLTNETAANTEMPKTQEAVAGNIAQSDVKKVAESQDEEGVHLSYIEENGKNNDTIHVSIPINKTESGDENTVSTDSANVDGNAVAASKPANSENTAAANDSLKFLDIDIKNSAKDSAVAGNATTEKASVIANSKCKDIATDEDFIRLRRKMAMESSDEKMIGQAKKAYRNKCFTTGQLKKLSTLFLSDEGRYDFFNASYNSVADVSEFSVLQSEFIDPAFATRFKALLQ